MSDSSLSTSLLERLRQQEELQKGLATLLVDDVFSRPVREHLAPRWMADAIAEDLRKSVASPGLKDWIAKRIQERLDRLPQRQEPLNQDMTPALQNALKTLVSRPSTPQPELVRAIVDQEGVRNLLQNILKRTLTDFGSKFAAPAQESSGLGGGLRSKLMGMAKGVAAVVGSELERQLEERVNSFLQGAMSRVIDMIVDRLSDPKSAKEGAVFRAHMVDSLLALPRHHFRSQAKTLDPTQTAADIYALLEALAQWDQLSDKILEIIEQSAGPDLDKNLDELLADSGLSDIWRARLQEQLQRYTHTIFHTEAFAQWLAKACESLP